MRDEQLRIDETMAAFWHAACVAGNAQLAAAKWEIVAEDHHDKLVGAGAELACAHEVLGQCAAFVAEFGQEMPVYGFFPGGDPRKFIPDPECSTEEERERHKKDCEALDRGETIEPAQVSGFEEFPEGTDLRTGKKTPAGVGFIERSPYGMGSYRVIDQDAELLLEKIRTALGTATEPGA